MPNTILAADRTLSCDTRATGLNNNLLVIGPSGSGKTRHVLKPNLLEMGSSFIVLDTKGTLAREMGPMLASHGYRVECLDFADLSAEASRPLPPEVHRTGYNPLAFVRYNAAGAPVQQDIISIARAICPVEDESQPFWDHAASNLLACLIAYVLEQLPERERHFGSVVTLAEHLEDKVTVRLLDELEATAPASFALALWRRYAPTLTAEKMHASISGILAEKIMCLGFDGARDLCTSAHRIDFAHLGRERRALFVTVNDIDRSLDPLTGLFVTQAFTTLIREADAQPGGRLRVPVRLILDDFANLNIPDIDGILAVIRSREIWCTLQLQSVNQLEAIYGRPRALSIMGNCDTHLVLAFQDIESARCYAERANKLASTLLATPLDRSWLFIRGRAGEQVRRYELTSHPRYAELAEAVSAKEATKTLPWERPLLGVDAEPTPA